MTERQRVCVRKKYTLKHINRDRQTDKHIQGQTDRLDRDV